MKNKSRLNWVFYLLILLTIIFLDRITKLWALNSCESPYIFNNIFSCYLVYNRGISWACSQVKIILFFYLSLLLSF